MSNDISPKDRALFRKAAGAVRPVRDNHYQHPQKKPPPRPKFREADEARVLQDMLSDHFDPLEIDTGDELIYLRAGMQDRTMKKLRRGQISIGAELDLHGMTVPVARAAIAEFLYESRRRRLQCIRIIHGKGLGSRQREPVLKSKVGGWLRQRDEVLAYCTARYYDGGTGAMYVLLKRF